MPFFGNNTVALYGACYTSTAVYLTAVAKGIGTSNYAPASGKGNGLVARGAIIHLEGQDIRFHFCATPAANCGMLMTSGSYFHLNSQDDIQNFKGVNTSGGSSTAVVFLSF